METTQAPRQPDPSRSDTIGALAAALAKAQGAMSVASKDKVNAAFGAKSKYADLASTWDACRAPLAANGLAVVQQVASVPEGVTVTTTLLHASGEWMRDRLTMPVEKKTAHGVGSAITYARRYALQAMVGIAPGDDDDGNEASAVVPLTPPPSGQKEAPRATSNKQTRVQESKVLLGVKPSAWTRIVELGALYGKTEEQMRSFCKDPLAGKKPADLSDADVTKIQELLGLVGKPA